MAKENAEKRKKKQKWKENKRNGINKSLKSKLEITAKSKNIIHLLVKEMLFPCFPGGGQLTSLPHAWYTTHDGLNTIVINNN